MFSVMTNNSIENYANAIKNLTSAVDKIEARIGIKKVNAVKSQINDFSKIG